MMIVISIMLILVTLTATMFKPDKEGRRVREAARAVNVYLASARNRAMETGRPCGVIFRNYANGASMNAEQCEVPPPFCGEMEQSCAQVQVGGGGAYVEAQLLDAAYPSIVPYSLTTGIVRPGDLIQFNCQGLMYRIHGDATHPPTPADSNQFNTVDSTGFVTGATLNVSVGDIGQNTMVPWSTNEKYVPYRIFRAPIKGFAQPLQLPVPSVVDLTASGVGTAFAGGADFTVLFSSTGAVECIYVGANRANVPDTIYLLIGKNERVANGYAAGNTNVDTLTNYQDLNNRWVTINPRTGAVQTEPVAVIPAGTTDIPTAILRSRDLAVEATGMGGK